MEKIKMGKVLPMDRSQISRELKEHRDEFKARLEVQRRDDLRMALAVAVFFASLVGGALWS